MTDTGIELIDAYIGPEGVLTGTSRLIQQAREYAAADERAKEIDQRRRQLGRSRQSLERQIAELQASLAADEDEQKALIAEEGTGEAAIAHNRAVVAASRGAPK